MGNWTKQTPPTFMPTAVATAAGWAHPTTGELLVAIGGLSAAKADFDVVPTFVATWASPATVTAGDILRLNVTAAEPVHITGTPTITVTLFGSVTRTLSYDSKQEGASSTVLPFVYTVTADDPLGGLVSVAGSMSGGKMYDISGESKVLIPANERTFVAPNVTGTEIV